MKWVARLGATLVWAAVLIAAVVGILGLIGVTAGNIVAAAAGLTLATVVWLPVTRRWNARAHVCWATTTYVFVVYLVFMMWWTFASHLGIAGDVGGMLLWLLELVAAGLGCAYLWELCDTLGRATWVRRGRHAGACRGAGRSIPVRVPPGALLQRAAGDGHRDAQVTALARLPELR